jgi:DNA-binding transcriptional regulator YiaG
MVDDAVRIRVIRAILGVTSKEFASRVGVSKGVITGWEKGRYSPQRKSRVELMKICQEHKIAFLPSGYPIPLEDMFPTQETTNG